MIILCGSIGFSLRTGELLRSKLTVKDGFREFCRRGLGFGLLLISVTVTSGVLMEYGPAEAKGDVSN